MCGLAGIINKTQRVFDYSVFCTLGIANDRRGGDSCGVFIDGNVEYGVGTDKLFEDFFLGSELLENTRYSTIALLHCRKASVGTISKDTAQPVVLRDEHGNVLFVVLHNGTIYNYKELAEKYIPNIDIKGMTDSQVMARIFFYSGYDVLNEYNGGAVFVIVDYRKASPRTFLFKGSSKDYSYSKESREERPLFYCINKSKRELVFSSIASYLMAVRRDDVAYILNPNVLYEFTGRDLTVINKYSRENCTQKKVITTTYSTVKVYGDDDDYYFQGYWNNYISIDLQKNIYSSKGKKCHGRMYLGEWGYVYNNPSKRHTMFEVWFFNGVALKNISCFKFLEKLRKESKLDYKEFSIKFENVIRFLSIDGVYPINGIWHKATSPIEHSPFSGEFHPITAQSVVGYLLGKQISTCYKNSASNMEKKLSQEVGANFKDVKELCKSLMK